MVSFEGGEVVCNMTAEIGFGGEWMAAGLAVHEFNSVDLRSSLSMCAYTRRDNALSDLCAVLELESMND